MEIMTPKQIRIRIDDDVLEVALTPAEFDKKAKEIISDDRNTDQPSQIERIVYFRGDLPHRSLGVAGLWWVIGIGGGLVFLYGLYSLVQKVMSYVVPFRD